MIRSRFFRLGTDNFYLIEQKKYKLYKLQDLLSEILLMVIIYLIDACSVLERNMKSVMAKRPLKIYENPSHCLIMFKLPWWQFGDSFNWLVSHSRIARKSSKIFFYFVHFVKSILFLKMQCVRGENYAICVILLLLGTIVSINIYNLINSFNKVS